jgi:Cys-tRNA synthase (O-phospho-L-seryl-tRNA:Cys-tRNA synthase)
LLLDIIVLRRRTELKLDIGPVESIGMLTFGAEKLILDFGNGLY